MATLETLGAPSEPSNSLVVDIAWAAGTAARDLARAGGGAAITYYPQALGRRPRCREPPHVFPSRAFRLHPSGGVLAAIGECFAKFLVRGGQTTWACRRADLCERSLSEMAFQHIGPGKFPGVRVEHWQRVAHLQDVEISHPTRFKSSGVRAIAVLVAVWGRTCRA